MKYERFLQSVVNRECWKTWIKLWWNLAGKAEFDPWPKHLRGACIVHFSLTILISVTMGWKFSMRFMTQQIGFAVSHSVKPSCRESHLFYLAKVRCLNDKNTETVELLKVREHIKILYTTQKFDQSVCQEEHCFTYHRVGKEIYTAGIHSLEASPWTTSNVIFSCFLIEWWSLHGVPFGSLGLLWEPT